MINGRGRVLVVDDDPAIRDLLADMLADEGYEIRTATNGREALEALRERPSDVILLDLMMPVMDGWAFRARQQAIPGVADIPVVVLSATYDVRAQAEALNAAAVVGKPFSVESLLTTVSRLVN